MGYPRKPFSWLEDFPKRRRLEQSARLAFPDMFIGRARRAGKLYDVYILAMDVPGYGHRRVQIEFLHKLGQNPAVFVDGPLGQAGSPHRYPERDGSRLCIWYPGDPPDRQWLPEDGLLALLGMIQEHLFKEAYWRENGVWLGEEAPHSPEKESA